STIFDTLLRLEATTRMSSRPNAATAAATMASQLASELGRLATIAVLPPSSAHAAATCLSSSSLLAASTTLEPAPASTVAAGEPNAPDAPVTMAILPRMSNRETGLFRISSDMGFLPFPSPSSERVAERSEVGWGSLALPQKEHPPARPLR